MPFREVKGLEGFYYLIHPRPVVLVLSKCREGRVNAMPASWNTPVSEDPPTLGIAIDRESYTFECVEYSGEVSINIPDSSCVDLVYALGTTSGRSVDKVRKYGLKLGKARVVSAPIWLDAIGVIEGRVRTYVDVGEVRLYVFDVLTAYVKEGVYGRWGWNLVKVNIPLHGAGKAFYLVGRRVMAGGKAG